MYIYIYNIIYKYYIYTYYIYIKCIYYIHSWDMYALGVASLTLPGSPVSDFFTINYPPD